MYFMTYTQHARILLIATVTENRGMLRGYYLFDHPTVGAIPIRFLGLSAGVF